MASTGSVYNHSRLKRQILRRHRKHPASFYLQLHPTWVRFEDSKGRVLLEETVVHASESIDGFDGETVAGPSRLVRSRVGTGSSAATGSRSLTPAKELLRCVRDQHLPSYMLDILDLKRIPFFEGRWARF